MNSKILVISSLLTIPEFAENLARALGLPVFHADSRKAALSLLRNREFEVVVVDDGLAESDPAMAELIWKNAGLAVPLQVNFAIANCERVTREIRAALSRRSRERILALRAASGERDAELRSIVTGLLLQSQLAMSQVEAQSGLHQRLQSIADLANSLREKLDAAKGEKGKENTGFALALTDNQISQTPIAQVV